MIWSGLFDFFMSFSTPSKPWKMFCPATVVAWLGAWGQKKRLLERKLHCRSLLSRLIRLSCKQYILMSVWFRMNIENRTNDVTNSIQVVTVSAGRYKLQISDSLKSSKAGNNYKTLTLYKPTHWVCEHYFHKLIVCTRNWKQIERVCVTENKSKYWPHTMK